MYILRNLDAFTFFYLPRYLCEMLVCLAILFAVVSTS